MKCPVCRLFNPEDAFACDCGYNFRTGTGGVRAPLHSRFRWLLIFVVVVVGLMFLGFLAIWLHSSAIKVQSGLPGKEICVIVRPFAQFGAPEYHKRESVSLKSYRRNISLAG